MWPRPGAGRRRPARRERSRIDRSCAALAAARRDSLRAGAHARRQRPESAAVDGRERCSISSRVTSPRSSCSAGSRFSAATGPKRSSAPNSCCRSRPTGDGTILAGDLLLARKDYAARGGGLSQGRDADRRPDCRDAGVRGAGDRVVCRKPLEPLETPVGEAAERHTDADYVGRRPAEARIDGCCGRQATSRS